MSKKVTIVMYHYVRDLAKSRYPAIKGLNLNRFLSQLDYLEERYSIVRMEDCLSVLEGNGENFPENAALLTFDDGYLEHFTEVYPVLDSRGLQGSFFPPVQSTSENKVLDVNKIHFILAVSNNPKKLLERLRKEISALQNEFHLKEPDDYFSGISKNEHAYDPLEIIIFKRVLQRELPVAARVNILNKLFEEIVGVSERVFANELYMNEDQVKHLVRAGMFVGGHGYSHKWLNSIHRNEKIAECQKTMSFLRSMGLSDDEMVMCYPYGGYDQVLIEILKSEGYRAGLSTEEQVAELTGDNRFKLGRYDTNEVEKLT